MAVILIMLIPKSHDSRGGHRKFMFGTVFEALLSVFDHA